MTTIASRQNATHQLQRLAAQRQLYGKAKKVLAFQFILAGPVAVASVLLAAWVPSVAVLVGLWGWLLTLTDVLFLSKAQKRYCESAAKVQEEFDCEAFELNPNHLKTGLSPDPELIKEQSDKYERRRKTLPPLRDWYSIHVDELPVEIGRLACQRSNCWWDSEQRSKYSFVLMIGLGACGAAILFISVLAGLTVESALKGLLLPLGPAIVLSLRHLNEHADAMTRATRLKNYAETLWNSALGGAARDELEIGSRWLQDELFEHRMRSPLIFDFIFRRLRSGFEAQMNYGVDELVRRAQARGIKRFA